MERKNDLYIRDKDIGQYLNEQGFRHALSGRQYIFEAIRLCMEEPRYRLQVVNIYKIIAQRSEVTYASVERCIRHSLQAAGIRETNKEFIARSVDFFLDRFD